MYSELFELHADLLKALAHPRRLEIIHLLRDQALCVSDIYEMLDLPQANISQHLMILRDAHVVTAVREGKQIIYKLANPRIIKASDLLREVLIDQHQGSEIADQLALNMKDLVPLVHDPVCHMRVSPKTAGFTTQHNNQPYYFCASGCLKKFEQNPEKFTSNYREGYHENK
jgi:DNA-binding transcriptional ArsR family regulator/YHS domain-containing protein